MGPGDWTRTSIFLLLKDFFIYNAIYLYATYQYCHKTISGSVRLQFLSQTCYARLPVLAIGNCREFYRPATQERSFLHKPISPILSGIALVGVFVVVGLKSSEAQSNSPTLPAEQIVTCFSDDANTVETIAHREEISAIDQVRKQLHAQHHPHDIIKTRSIPSNFNPCAMASVADFPIEKKLWSSSKSDRAYVCTYWKAKRKSLCSNLRHGCRHPSRTVKAHIRFRIRANGQQDQGRFRIGHELPDYPTAPGRDPDGEPSRQRHRGKNQPLDGRTTIMAQSPLVLRHR